MQGWDKEDLALKGWFYDEHLQAQGSRWELQIQTRGMDDVEVQGGKNLPFLLVVLLKQFGSGIHDFPYAFYKELIAHISEIPE